MSRIDNWGYMGTFEMGTAAGSLGRYFAAGARWAIAGTHPLFEDLKRIDPLFCAAWVEGHRYAKGRLHAKLQIHPDVFTTEEPRWGRGTHVENP